MKAVWRAHTSVNMQVTAEVLAERKRVTNAGLSALARVESCRRFGTTPEAADLEAVQ